jgi:hypothetical protein
VYPVFPNVYVTQPGHTVNGIDMTDRSRRRFEPPSRPLRRRDAGSVSIGSTMREIDFQAETAIGLVRDIERSGDLLNAKRTKFMQDFSRERNNGYGRPRV